MEDYLAWFTYQRVSIYSYFNTSKESVQFAIKKYDKLDIGDGFVLSVSKADYSKSKQKKLPPECQADEFPVCIIKNIFDAKTADDR